MKSWTFFCLGLLLAMSVPSMAEDTSFKLIVNAQNPVQSLTHEQVSKLFLRKTTQWSAGGLVLPVDQAEGSRVREGFTGAVHHKTVGAVKSYWQQQLFSGRGVPPPEKGSDADVTAYVSSNEGAIGYVSMNAKLGGVKVVNLTDN